MKLRSAHSRIPLFDLSLSKRTRNEVAGTLASGWLTSGPKVAAFENAVRDYLNVKYAAAVSSATAGLYLALRAAGACQGREVVTTPFTFVATVEAILMTGATPIFADIDPRTLNIDVADIAQKVSDRTMAVLAVDIAGYPADYGRLRQICRERSLFLLADAAHSFGAAYKNKASANQADAAVCSFYPTKNLTCGEGGMVLSNRKQIIDQVRRLSIHSQTSSTYERTQKRTWDYDVVDLGFKANMSDVHAAIGLGQLSTFEKDQARRVALAERYRENLSGLSDFLELPKVERHCRHGWHLFIIKLNLPRLRISRDRFIGLMASYGIECGVHYKPIFELTYYRRALELSSQDYPNATSAGHRVVTLPLYPLLKIQDIDYICDRVAAIVSKHIR
jgi:dTDP-4-amino-4,6-dideoxygalactose transaminase